MKRRSLAVIVSGALLVLGGCASSDPVTASEASGVTALIGTSSGSGSDALLLGEIAVVGDCLGVQAGEQFWAVVWPRGAVFDGATLTWGDLALSLATDVDLHGGFDPVELPETACDRDEVFVAWDVSPAT